MTLLLYGMSCYISHGISYRMSLFSNKMLLTSHLILHILFWDIPGLLWDVRVLYLHVGWDIPVHLMGVLILSQDITLDIHCYLGYFCFILGKFSLQSSFKFCYFLFQVTLLRLQKRKKIRTHIHSFHTSIWSQQWAGICVCCPRYIS